MKPGDYVEAELENESIHGILIQSNEQQKEFIILKLSSGYNIGIHKRNVKNVVVVEEKKERKEKKEEVKQNEKLPKIVILHTGGTIASKVDYETGAVAPKFSPDELLSLFPELKEVALIDSKLVANILSENMGFDHYNIVGKAISEEIKKGAQGIIITHGTDTLHYTSAALAFMLEHLDIPVILVGSQRSSDRGSSDAASNLMSAVAFAANSTFKGVAVCMHENDHDVNCVVIDGLHARKMHTSKREAFKTINRALIAKVNYQTKKIDIIKMQDAQEKGSFQLKLFDPEIKVGIAKMHPGMHEDAFNFKGFDGLVIEGTGLGHAPIEEMDAHSKMNAKIKKQIESLAKHMPVVMTSQAIYGRINMNVYRPGRVLQEMGVLGHNLDMTTEVAFIKLAWLLSQDKKHVKSLYSQNLRGEISERTEQDDSVF
jgi:glutamyl-tRNA(Gln) amidotransferase subunit D